MDHRSYDLTVVGAGFAGLACAQAAALRGLRTAVLDAKPAAGIRPHTTGLLVKEVADEWDVPRRLCRKVRGVRLYAPSHDYVDLQRPGYYFLATDTPALLRWWADEATRNGVHLRWDSPVRSVDRFPHHLSVRGAPVDTRYIVGADGAKSHIARCFDLPKPSRFLVGVEAEFQNVRGVDGDHLHVFLDSKLAPGYIAWLIPGVDGVTQVGLAVNQGRVPQLDAFVESIGDVFDFSGAQIVARRGGMIPCGGPIYPMGTDRALLIGDAAGLVSPLTAGGIHTAIHYGRAAGIAVADHLIDAGPDPVRVMHRSTPRYRFKGLLRRAYDLHPPNLLYDLAIGSPALRAVAASIFFHNRGLMSPQTWTHVAHDLVFAGR